MLKQKGQCKAAWQSLQAAQTTMVTTLYEAVFHLSFKSNTHAGEIKKEAIWVRLEGKSHGLKVLLVQHPASDHLQVFKHTQVSPFLWPGINVQIACTEKAEISLMFDVSSLRMFLVSGLSLDFLVSAACFPPVSFLYVFLLDSVPWTLQLFSAPLVIKSLFVSAVLVCLFGQVCSY